MSKEFTKEEIIGKQFNLDLGSSSPVSVIVKDIKQDIDLSYDNYPKGNIDKVIVEYLYSTPGRTEEFTLSNFEYLACIEIIPTETKMNKEPANTELEIKNILMEFHAFLKNKKNGVGFSYDYYNNAIVIFDEDKETVINEFVKSKR